MNIARKSRPAILTIAVDGLILFFVSTAFVYLADLGFSGLKKKVPKDDPVVTAIAQGEIKSVEAALTAVETQLKGSAKATTQMDEHGRTSLMRAAYVNLSATAAMDYALSMLRMRKVDPKHPSGFPLDNVRSMCEKRTATVNKNATASIGEADGKRAPMIALLAGHGAQIDAQDHDGWTALMWASWSGLEKTADELLKLNASHSLADNQGYTALAIASMRGNVAIVRSLITKGVDKNVSTRTGKNALDLAKTGMNEYPAKKVDYQEIVTLLSGTPSEKQSD